MLLPSLPNVSVCPLCPMQQYSRGNSSGSTQANSLKDLLQNKIDDMEKQVLSRVNTLEETKPASRNETEQRNRVESTLTSLHHRLTDLEKGTPPHTNTHTHPPLSLYYFFDGRTRECCGKAALFCIFRELFVEFGSLAFKVQAFWVAACATRR